MNETTRQMQEAQEVKARIVAAQQEQADCCAKESMPTPRILQDLQGRRRQLETILSDTRNKLNIINDLVRVFEDR